MTPFDGVQTVIFDYDGTLHDSRRIYIPAFLKAYQYLVKAGKAEPEEWEEADITRWLGYSKKEMWEAFMPDLEAAFQTKASNIIGQTMLEKIEEGQAALYPEAIQTLDYLKDKGYQLIFLSNCSVSYMERHRQAFGLNYYFDAFYCSEQYAFKKSKKEIVELFKDDYKGELLIVGDRFQDIEAGEVEGVHAVGCTYGFGQGSELSAADKIIHNISELKNLL
ncbi:Phosphoglycolate phosphatase [Alkalibacterium sp. AK22]|uniref:HAD family hydrolase n=1 Tax=Alkalibacterium sp. AK22 TaxID=1229520 RepID=UPI0004465304|nr:HAD family hydrolase [Alkalibacterium sp. AK22]EXJ23205.1 Phosphoglycolate phosphatase [Alkalibacterium sp. AK22]